MANGKLSSKEQKQRTMRTYRILTLVFTLLSIAAPIAVLVFSFTTISSVTVLDDNTTILNGEDPKYTDPCGDVTILDEHRPVRFAFENETEAFSCPWPVLNTVFHFVLSFAGIALVIVAFIFTFPRRGPLLYLFATLIALVGFGFGYTGYDDSSRIAKSNKWCLDGFNSMPWTNHPAKDEFDCRYSPFILTAVMDFLSAAVCILLGFFSICFVCRAPPVVPGKRKKDSLLPESDTEEEETPDPFEKLAHKGKDPKDTFGEPEEEPKPKPKRGGLFGLFGGGKKEEPSATPTPEGSVNFEQESSSRFAPMSKTDREASNKPLGTADKTQSSGNVGNALFNFDDVPSDSTQKPAQPEEPKPRPAPAQPAKAQPQKPAPKQSGGMVDFESLAGAEENPFA